ncbi:hypothetical protein [Paenibacillus naphthalenovorans]|uniref:hypothetical protein n=1 Tax=Paenibacillus naphthalenovorans TaxID=162209 RepID=UPI003D2A0FDA
MAYSGRKALVKVGGVPVAMTDEATTVLSGTDITTDTQYQITAVTKRIIDMNSSITVKVDGTVVTTGFKVDMLRGTVIFDTSAVRTVTVTGKYVPTSTAAECYEWSINLNGELIDVTKFQDEWATKIQGLKSAEGSLSRWYNVDRYFSNALISGSPVIVEMYTQDTLNPDRIWALINSDEMSAAVDGASEEAVSFESTDKMLVNYIQ